jgi:asparagine synthase (glutamine-hydrolysing)
MRRAREEGVLVLLDGQGGDEVLCGYRKFYAFHLLQLLRQRRLPRFLSELAGCLLRGDSRLFDLRGGNRYVRSVLGLSAGGACAHLLNPRLRAEFQGQGASLMGGRTLAERQIMDLTRWSVPVLLRYEDRNSMAFAVEARLPFLDYRLAELCLGLPDEAKLSGGWTKVVLREALKGILPEMVRLRRTKLGFETPEELWLKGPLAGKMRDLLAGELASAAYLDVATLRSEFEGYLAGRSRLSATDFFRALMLEMWFRVFGVS